MKKIILLFILIFSTENSIAQCSISFEDIYNSATYNSSSFQSFAKKNGYTYDSKEKSFVCSQSVKNENRPETFKNEFRPILSRDENLGGHILIRHIFFSREIYLSYKELLETNGYLKKTDSDEGILTLQYIYNGKLIILSSFEKKSISRHSITISNQKI